MKPERWKQIDALFDAVEELPAERRGAFLAAACAGDEDLRREVLSLLAEREKVSADFMERPAMKVVAQGISQHTAFQNVPFAGRELSTYKVERLLGAGGMGEIYLAHDGKLNRKVALKILPAAFVSDAERLRRFEREARAVSALNHPNIVTIYDVGEADGWHFIATEFVEGKTLREAAGEKLSLKEVLSVAAQAAEALAAAHGAGVVHRDIKPENIMLRADGYVKVLDFGLAKLSEPGPNPAGALAQETQAGVVMGTLAYMSPEQATGEAVDHRTDIWSLGCVLYELATGNKPFARENRQSTINAILSGDPEAASASDPNLPAELDHVLGKALEKDRELRYQTASDFRADLRRLLKAIDSSPSWSSGKAVAARRPKPRRWVAPAAAGLALLAAAGFFGWRFFRPQRSSAPDWSRATNMRLTDQAGTEFYPGLSPDGKSFVYASKPDGNYDLFLQRVGGKNPTNLTEDSAADDTQPAFSPDGERIAFRSEREPRGIYVMEATGENVRRVSDSGFHPSWSPDGKEIVFSKAGRDLPNLRNTNPSALWIVHVETEAKRLLLAGTDAMQPAWSPHGGRIAFWFMPPGVGRSDIATVARTGGEPVVVTRDASANWNPVWSPDGEFLYFASDRSGNMNFWRVRVDEETGRVLSEPEAVVTPSKFSRHLSFSRDGRRMIYVQTDDRSNIQAVGFDARSEKITGEPLWITRGDRQVVRPELSPDGKQFVMRVPRRTQDDIVLVSRDGAGWRDLTNDKFFDRYPRWSPDGKKIVFVSDRSGSYEIWTIDADGTNLRQLTFDSPQGTSFPVWSPDGQRLLFRKSPASLILDLNKSWGEQTPPALPPTDNPADAFVVWDWSPDGKKLAGTFSGSGNGLGYFSFETNRYEKVADLDGLPGWLPDSRRLVFAHEGKAFIADTVTKKVREIFSRPAEEIRSIAVSREGRLLYYTVLSSENDIWLLHLE